MKGRLHELMMKKMKEGKTIDPDSKEARAKADVLNEIKEMMNEIEGGKLKGLKKVTVAAPSQEGLEAGLEKAQEVVEEMSEEDEEDDLVKLKNLAMKKAKDD